MPTARPFAQAHQPPVTRFDYPEVKPPPAKPQKDSKHPVKQAFCPPPRPRGICFPHPVALMAPVMSLWGGCDCPRPHCSAAPGSQHPLCREDRVCNPSQHRESQGDRQGEGQSMGLAGLRAAGAFQSSRRPFGRPSIPFSLCFLEFSLLSSS